MYKGVVTSDPLFCLTMNTETAKVAVPQKEQHVVQATEELAAERIDAWLGELEIYSYRFERLQDDIALGRSVKPWLMAAYLLAKKEDN